MKTFIAGFVVATVGLSGISHLIDFGLNVAKTHMYQFNAEIQQVGQ